MTGKRKESIKKSIFIAAAPDRIFKAITTSSEWDQYFTSGMELDPRAGGVCNFKWKDWGPELFNGESPGKILEFDPPKKLVFEWGSPGKETVARMEIEPKYDGSILTLTEDGYPDDDEGLRYLIECSAHWGELLTLIKFYIEHGLTYRSPDIKSG
jgi:uncharacterized protein YndB with AHSA1/START domain